MPKIDIDLLIVKFVENTISADEFLVLKSWLKEEDSEAYFKKFLEINYLINSKKLLNKERTLFKIRSEIIRTEFKQKNKRLRFFTIATSIAFLLALGLTFSSIFNKEIPPQHSTGENIKKGSHKAILTLNDGHVIAFDEGRKYVSDNVSSNGDEITYKNQDKVPNSKKEYNTIEIPRGGQFALNLADGTKVWLNSSSKLKYPVNFVKGEARKVELIYGEAYFDVSPIKEHQGSRFVVDNNGYTIEVSGTEFNLKSYKEEQNVVTTLVEGKVNIGYQDQNYDLNPSQQAVLNKGSNTMVINKVDVYDQVSWKEGIFSFKRKSLKEIMVVLSRWYDMEVVFENKSIENRGFNGELGKDQDIIEILQSLKQFGAVNEYEIHNKTVTLK